MKKCYLSSFLCISLLFSHTACANDALKHPSSKIGVKPVDVKQAILQTGDLLISLVQPTGQFTYRFHLSSSRSPKRRYNILRHAGAIYALGQLQQIAPSQKNRSTIQHAAQFMMNCCYQKIETQPELGAIWSLPEISGKKGTPVAKLGGAGLALVALATTMKTKNSPDYEKEMMAIGNFILHMQKKDGTFYSKFYQHTLQPDDSWTSLYYPGEAALGLLYLDELFPNPQWKDSANRALLALANERTGQATVPSDHWALIATERLLRNHPEISNAHKTIHITHVSQIVDSIGRTQNISTFDRKIRGAFDANGRTTPTATRIEGLVAAYHVLSRTETSPKSLHALRQHIENGVAFLITSQVKGGKYNGAIQRAMVQKNDNSAESQSFNKRMDEVRIDYLQHAISAMYGYVKIAQD